MKYLITDFCSWEQPLINQLRKEGKFIYGLRNSDGAHYTIEPTVHVNSIGFIITDKALDLGKNNLLSDEEFFKQDVEEDTSLKKTDANMTEALEQAKASYNAKEMKRNAQIKEIMSIQDNLKERDFHYKLWQKNMAPKKPCKQVGIENYTIVVQSIKTISETEQEVLYFVKDIADKIIIDSTYITTRYNCRFGTILKKIAKKHSLN